MAVEAGDGSRLRYCPGEYPPELLQLFTPGAAYQQEISRFYMFLKLRRLTSQGCWHSSKRNRCRTQMASLLAVPHRIFMRF